MDRGHLNPPRGTKVVPAKVNGAKGLPGKEDETNGNLGAPYGGSPNIVLLYSLSCTPEAHTLQYRQDLAALRKGYLLCTQVVTLHVQNNCL